MTRENITPWLDAELTRYPQNLHLPPIARDSDPDTSHEAAEHITKDGSRDSQCQKILAVIQTQPGIIPGEIAAQTGLLTHMVIKRIHDLEVKKLVKPGTPRVWSGTGKKQRSWFPVPQQGALL